MQILKHSTDSYCAPLISKAASSAELSVPQFFFEHP